MPTRVADADVKAIFATRIDTTPFILAANLLVTQHFTGVGYSDAQLMELERYWAAHIACARDPRLAAKQIDDTRYTYDQGKPGIGLQSTRYGQMVLSLDTLGVLTPIISPDAVGTKFAKIRVD